MDDYQLSQHLKTHRYGVVDASMREDIPENCEQAVIAPHFLKDDTSRCPALVDVTSLAKDEYNALLTKWIADTYAKHETFFSLLLKSDAPLVLVAKQLGERLRIQLEPEDRPMQFRYFDPATFLQLPTLIGDEGMAWLLESVDSALIPWMGEFTVINRPQNPQPLNFKLNAEHLQGLHRITIVNRVQLGRRFPPKNQAEWLTRAAAIDTYISRALQHGLDDMRSIVIFCQHALEYHPRFDEHPELQTIFKQLADAVPEDQLTYYILTNALRGEGWQTIVQDCLDGQVHGLTAMQAP